MSAFELTRLHVIDSHTAGEPTRIVVAGGPELGRGPLRDQLTHLRRHDELRRAVVLEPRGSEVIVGALLCEPSSPAAAAGVIFFNNVGYLGMCGHGTIGLIVTLAHMGRIGPGRHKIETPVGMVGAELHGDGSVTVENVPSYRRGAQMPLRLDDGRVVHGDVAWGGNWFYLCDDHGQRIAADNIEALTDFAWRIRRALPAQGITGDQGAEIDHIELFGPPTAPGADSKNFVLCPGKAYDRSPCGTGTSAKLACLHALGKLPPGEIWRQESVIGTIFEASYRLEGGRVVPSIKGSAYVTAEAELIFDARDPFRAGIGAGSHA